MISGGSPQTRLVCSHASATEVHVDESSWSALGQGTAPAIWASQCVLLICLLFMVGSWRCPDPPREIAREQDLRGENVFRWNVSPAPARRDRSGRALQGKFLERVLERFVVPVHRLERRSRAGEVARLDAALHAVTARREVSRAEHRAAPRERVRG